LYAYEASATLSGASLPYEYVGQELCSH